jgi:NAD(P)-dependent dehydrogenase (short-subunit alcohol dehydrogenase family)
MSGALQGKVGLVTGSAAGIGRGIALLFAREGCSVVVSDIDVEGGRETVELIRAAGAKASFVAADVSSEADMQHLVEFAVTTYGSLHVAVNNAGIEPEFVLMHELSLSSWERVLRINLTGVFLGMKHQIAHMIAHGGGSIVNISSIAAVKSTPKSHCYAASKRGVLALTSCAAVEYAAKKVRVNAIMPGATMTRMMEETNKLDPEILKSFAATIPMGGFAQPDDIAQAALWLSSDAASYVTGQHFSVDGGVTA